MKNRLKNPKPFLSAKFVFNHTHSMIKWMLTMDFNDLVFIKHCKKKCMYTYTL